MKPVIKYGAQTNIFVALGSERLMYIFSVIPCKPNLNDHLQIKGTGSKSNGPDQ